MCHALARNKTWRFFVRGSCSFPQANHHICNQEEMLPHGQTGTDSGGFGLHLTKERGRKGGGQALFLASLECILKILAVVEY